MESLELLFIFLSAMFGTFILDYLVRLRNKANRLSFQIEHKLRFAQIRLFEKMAEEIVDLRRRVKILERRKK